MDLTPTDDQAPTHQALSEPTAARLIDASQAADIQTWVPITYRQLTPGPFSGIAEASDLAGIGLFHECHAQDVSKTGVVPAGQCTISFIDRGDANARFSQFVIDGEDVTFFQPQLDEFDIRMPGGRANTYARVDQEELLRKLAVLNEPLAEQLATSRGLQSLGRQGKWPLELVMHRILAQSQGREVGVLSRQALRRNLMEQILLVLNANSIAHAGTAPNLHGRRRAWRIVHSAREYMESCLHTGTLPDMVDLCRHVRVSERTLRNAFRSQFGHPPGVYLRLIRFNGVRTELLHASPTTTSVTAAATRWGFIQLGRFAHDYRVLFGERPSETLARS